MTIHHMLNNPHHLALQRAQLYHAHNLRHLEDLPFWIELAAQYGEPVLELGCGTGRVLLALIHAGVTSYGVDIDPAMLILLRQNIQTPASGAAHIIQADFTRLCLERRFPLIIMPCNTYTTLPGSSRHSLLKTVQAHLLPDSVFAISLPNPSILDSLPRRGKEEVEEIFSHPEDGEPVQVSSAWKHHDQELEIFWHYDHLHPDGTVTRTTIKVKHDIHSTQEILTEIMSYGFKDVIYYGDFDGSSYQERSPHLILLARS